MRVINKKKALYNSLMEGISSSLRNTLNEDNNGMHMDLHDDFTITQDENTAKSFVAYLKAINKKQRLSQEDECKLADIIQHSPNKRQVEAAKINQFLQIFHLQFLLLISIKILIFLKKI